MRKYISIILFFTFTSQALSLEEVSRHQDEDNSSYFLPVLIASGVGVITAGVAFYFGYYRSVQSQIVDKGSFGTSPSQTAVLAGGSALLAAKKLRQSVNKSRPGQNKAGSSTLASAATLLVVKPLLKPAATIEETALAAIDRDRTRPSYQALHVRLWIHSPRYRELVLSVNQRLGRNFAIIGLNQGESFEFHACWFESASAVRITDSFDLSDDQIGGLIAFELTNGFQQEEFKRTHQEAMNGEFSRNSPRNPAQAYAIQMENIESRGQDIHRDIINEAITNGIVAEDESSENWLRWSHTGPSYTRFGQYLSAGESESHIAYYERFYNNYVAPKVAEEKRSKLSERMKKLREAAQLN